VGCRRPRGDHGPDRCLQPAVGCLTSTASSLWGSRTRPPVLTWAFRRLARIR
jgi:hypothetical protein